MINVNDVDDRDLYRILMSGKMDDFLNGIVVRALTECPNLWDAVKEDEDTDLILKDIMREMADQILTLRAQYVDDAEDGGPDDMTNAEDAGLNEIMSYRSYAGLYGSIDQLTDSGIYNSGIIEISFSDSGQITDFIGGNGQYFLCTDEETGCATFKHRGEI